MKRIYSASPMIISFVMFILLCMSLSYWGIHLFKPQSRAVTAPPQAAVYEPNAGQWGNLFGSSQIVAASNYQLKGVVLAKRQSESVAIIAANGKPAQAVGINQELSPGIKLQEVHAQYILISENGVIKKIELPATAILGGFSGSSNNTSGIVPPANPPAFPQSHSPVLQGVSLDKAVIPGMPVIQSPDAAAANASQ